MTFFDGTVTVVVVVGVVVVVVDVEVDVDVDVEVLVVVEPVVVVVDVVVWSSAAGLCPATTAAVNPPRASNTQATTAVPILRMG